MEYTTRRTDKATSSLLGLVLLAQAFEAGLLEGSTSAERQVGIPLLATGFASAGSTPSCPLSRPGHEARDRIGGKEN